MLARVQRGLRRARRRKRLARRHRFVPNRGRAAARCRPWRHGDQCRDGARQGGEGEAARSRRADRRPLRATILIATRRYRRPGFINLTLKPVAWADALRTVLREGAVVRPERVGGGRKGQRRIRLGQSDRADACRPLPRRGVRRRAGEPAAICRATTSPANITSTTPARRSTCSRARRYLRYREALGEDIGEIPEGLYPGDYLKPVGQALAAEHGDKLLRAMPEAAMAADRARQGDRDDDGR